MAADMLHAALFALLSCQDPAPPPAAQVPDAANFEQWLTFIRPSADEQAFRAIGWRNEFWPAVQEARQLGRPLLFWTMNGHPLGCT